MAVLSEIPLHRCQLPGADSREAAVRVTMRCKLLASFSEDLQCFCCLCPSRTLLAAKGTLRASSSVPCKREFASLKVRGRRLK